MDIIIGWQDYKTEFNGTEVSMQLRPLTRRGFLLILPYMQIFEKFAGGSAPSDIEAQSKIMELQGMCRELFADHMQNFAGFTVNGKPPTVEQLTDESIFATLCIDIITHLLTISVLDRGQAKNSGGQSTTKEDTAA